MKKATLFLLMILMISMSSYGKGKYKARKGKSSDSKGYYSFSIGPSLPMGNYAKKNTEGSDASGFAKTGLHINLANFGYKIVSNFGICGVISVGANSFNAKEATTYEDKDSYWVYANFMLGPLASFDAGDKISIDLRPMAGLAYAASPEVNYNGSAVLIKSDRKSTFGVNIGATCRYHMSDRADLGLNLDYFSAEQKFKPEFLGTEGEWKQKMNLLGVTVGMAFKF